ncbi:MAG: hypothetical protein KDH93_10745 [Rhodoferax sp.]|nr:hypothetical protein [Rhodoferax sp.]
MKLAYTIPEAVKLGPFARTRLYELWRAGHIEFRKDGRKTVILHDELVRAANSLPVKRPSDEGADA